MRYAEHRPPPALAPFVECLWTAEDEGAPAPSAETPLPEAIVPDGCLEWIFHLGSPYRRFLDSGRSQIQPASFFVGLITGPLWLAPTGSVATLGVRFRPGGAHPLLRLPLEELTDSAVATPDLFGAAGRALEETIAVAPGLDSARSAVERFLTGRLESRVPDPRVGAAVSAVLRSGGRAPVSELARLSAWSPRQLEREFRRRVGMSPKTLSRIARFQNALRLSARAPGASWAPIAAEAGYADQAHLIRDFRDLSGTTPSRRRETEGDLSRHFVDPTRLDTLLGASPQGAGSGDVAFVQDTGCARS